MKAGFQIYKDYLLRNHPFLFRFNFPFPLLFGAGCSILIFLLLAVFPVSMLMGGHWAKAIYNAAVLSPILAFGYWLFKINQIDKRELNMGALLQLLLSYPVVVMLFFSPLFTYYQTIDLKYEKAPKLTTLQQDLALLQYIIEYRYQMSSESIDLLSGIDGNIKPYELADEAELEMQIARINQYYQINLDREIEQGGRRLPLIFGSLYAICGAAGNDINLVLFCIFVLQLLLVIPYASIIRLVLYTLPVLILADSLAIENNEIPLFFSPNMPLNDAIPSLIIVGFGLAYVIYLFYSFTRSLFAKSATRSAVRNLNILAFIIVCTLGMISWSVTTWPDLHWMLLAFALSTATLLVFSFQIRRLQSIPITDEHNLLPQFQENILFQAGTKLVRNFPMFWSINIPTFLVYLLALNLAFFSIVFAIQQIALLRMVMLQPVAILVNLLLIFSYINSLRHFSFKKFLINIHLHEYASYILIITILTALALVPAYKCLESDTMGKIVAQQKKNRALLLEIREDLVLFSAADSVINRYVSQSIPEAAKILGVDFDALVARMSVDEVVLNYQKRQGNQVPGILGVQGKDTLFKAGSSKVFIDSITPMSYLRHTGLKEGFIVEKINNRTIRSFKHLREEVRRYHAGDTVSLNCLVLGGDSIWQPQILSAVLNNEQGSHIFMGVAQPDYRQFYQWAFLSLCNKWGSPLNCTIDDMKNGEAYAIDTNYYDKRLKTIKTMCAFHKMLDATPPPETDTTEAVREDTEELPPFILLAILSIFLILVITFIHGAGFNRMNVLVYYLSAFSSIFAYGGIILGKDITIPVTVLIAMAHLSLFYILYHLRNRTLAVLLFFINYFTFSLLLIELIFDSNVLSGQQNAAIIFLFFFLLAFYSLMLYFTNMLLHRPDDQPFQVFPTRKP